MASALTSGFTSDHCGLAFAMWPRNTPKPLARLSYKRGICVAHKPCEPSVTSVASGNCAIRSRSACGFSFLKCAGLYMAPSARQAAAAYQVHGKAAQPVPAFVMLGPDALETGLPEPACERRQMLAPRVLRGQPRENTFEHPCAAEIQSSQVIQLAVRHIRDTS